MTGDTSMLNHESARRLMAEAVEGKLDQAQERDLAMHLVGCDECKRLYEGLQHAHPALASLAPGSPPTAAVDAAVFRATAILRGEADPGPMGLPPQETGPTTWTLDTGPLLGDEAVESPGATPPKLPERPPPSRSEAEAQGAKEVEPVEVAETLKPSEQATTPVASTPPVPILPIEKTPEPEAAADKLEPTVPPPPKPDRPELPELPKIEAEPPKTDMPSTPPPVVNEDKPAAAPPPQVPDSISIDLEPPPRKPPVRVGGEPSKDVGGRSRSEIEELLGQSEYEMRRKRPVSPDDAEKERSGVGGWLIAIAISVALAVIAVVLITRGPNLFGGGGDAPPASEIKSGIAQQFTDLRSLKTSFDIQRLSLYRVPGQENSYAFSNGNYVGRIVYDRGEGYRQEFTLTATVQGQEREISKAEIVQRGDETRSVVGSASPPTVNVEKRHPLAPPDGQQKPQMGLLEESVGSVVGLIRTAETIEVLGTEKRNDRNVYKIQFAVQATDLTRADRIEALLDSQSKMPVVIKRSISRENAHVLGPEQAVTDEVLNTAFGSNDRITTEVVELDNVIIDDIVLPGDFVLDTPQGTQTQESDFGFARVSRTDAADRLDFDPLFPLSLPSGFSEQLVAIYTGEPKGWGPNNAYPKPTSVFNATYFDGKTTIAVSERKVPTFNATSSPLQRGGLPITVKSVERDEKRFSYGSSPEVSPHVYGFLGEVFVVVSGYASEDELLDFIAQLGPATGEAPAVPSPGATSSPGATATPAP